MMVKLTTERRKRLTHWLLIAGMVLLATFMTATIVQLQIKVSQLTAMHNALQDEQQAARDRGEEPVAPEPDDLMDDPDGYDGAKTTGMSEAEVRDLVREAVRDYVKGIDTDDDDQVTESDIIAAVSNALAKRGVEIFGDRLAKLVGDEVAQQLAEIELPRGEQGESGEPGASGSPGPQGEQGEQGEAGRPPTPEEIGAAVEAFVAERGLPMCPDGYETQELDVLTTSGTKDSILCVKM